MKNKKNYVAIAVITVMLAAVVVMEMFVVFSMTSEQTMESGKYRLESISGELENTINEAKNYTMQLAVALQPHIDDKAELSDLIYSRREKLAEEMDGAYNIYIAGSYWSILPGLEDVESFVPTSRGWYIGAQKNAGSAYVTPPYIDAVTGNICYTVSVMLTDNDTVLCVDYTMDNIRSHIVKMNENGLKKAVIVTDDGIIAGCSDDTLVGETLSDKLPEYSAVFYLAKNSDKFVTHRIKNGIFYENLFAARSGSGWYLIVSESDWELYQNSYIQLIIILALSLILMSVIIILYAAAARSRRKTEDILRSKSEFITDIAGEIEVPLKKILTNSDLKNYPDIDTAEERLSDIHDAGKQLSFKIEQIVSYNNIVQSDKKEKEESKLKENRMLRMNKRFRNVILILLLIVMIITLFSTLFLSRSLAGSEMVSAVNSYEHQLSEWINNQKDMLDILTNLISIKPEMIEDYEGTIEYLDEVAKKHTEISAIYLANPKWEHTVYMNGGWEPDDDWHVEERQWYVDTLAAKDGWSISAPYYDEQTGIYCVTFSERVYDAETNEFLGIFGIDFYMDKLVGILSGSYSDNDYAFLADASGNIINHPYGKYQMSLSGKTNVSDLNYGTLNTDGNSTIVVSDYDGAVRVITAKRNEISNFVVYKASDVWNIYGQGFIIGVLCFVMVTICFVIVLRLLSVLIRWQDKVNNRMKEAADAATAAGRAKSSFLAHMSHEIRTPINAVLGMNEMILREADNNDILEYSENIQTAGKNLLSLINSILDFSKIEDGKMEIIPVTYDTASVINNLINSVSGRAEAKGLEFITKIDPDIPCSLIGDDVRVTQVILNLLTNAVKYTENGSVTFSMTCKEKTDNKTRLVVAVKDTGIGIKAEDMGKLFESFSRLDEMRNRNIEGTGLGMAIVTKLLDLMGTKLDVESVYGSGSVFSFEIEQGIADETPIGTQLERRAEPLTRKEKEKPHFHDVNVLVTDDNDMNLKVAKNLLKLFGIVPDLAVSGFETIERMREKRYDIVFLDHMMPKMDGIETLRKIKDEDLKPDDTVVIALTANAVNGAKEEYLNAGFDDYLSKPIELAQLEKKLFHYLSRDALDSGKSENPESTESTEEVSGSSEKEEILEFSPADPENSSSGESKDMITRLTDVGIFAGEGLAFCANDEGFYREMLEEYISSRENRLAELGEAFGQNDIKNYEVYVHALKSISKTIGVNDVSVLAKDLEFAAKRSDEEFIKLHHKELIKMFIERTKQIESIISDK